MRMRLLRKMMASRAAVGIGLVAMLAVGLVVGFALGSHSPAAKAVGMNGAILIYPDGGLSVNSASISVTQPAGTCNPDGNSKAVTCNFSSTPHDGPAIRQDGVVECFFLNPDYSYFTSFDSLIVYAPSGQVHIRCAR